MEKVIRNIDKEKYIKAKLGAKAKGSNLTTVLREKIYELAEEYEKKINQN